MTFFEKLREVVYTYKTNLIMGGIIILTILISNFCIYCMLANNSKKDIPSSEIVYLESKYDVKEDIDVKEEIYYKVDIKGAVANEGVYELKEKSRVIEKTTTNMIQKINPIFAVNPLISKEI